MLDPNFPSEPETLAKKAPDTQVAGELPPPPPFESYSITPTQIVNLTPSTQDESPPLEREGALSYLGP